MDPFGGIKGKEKKTLSGFSIDKEEALAELALSIKLFERKDQKKKKSFLESLQNKNKHDADIAPNWDYMKNTNLEYINIHLRWTKKTIKTINIQELFEDITIHLQIALEKVYNGFCGIFRRLFE